MDKATVHPGSRWALPALLAAGCLLVFTGLAKDGWANEYYAAGVQAMASSPQAWFFAAFDAGLHVSLDKPPVGFWLQSASAAVFGFSPWSLALPQALAFLATLAVLYLVVARRLGGMAGLFAGLAFLATPIAAATARNNTPDMVLVFLVTAAAALTLRGIERDRIRHVILAAALVGLAFQVKMLQAVVVLPALVAVLWLSPWKPLRKLAVTGGAAAAFLVVALSWLAIVELTPADQRPWVGGTTGNSGFELVFGHNGLSRLSGGALPQAPERGPEAGSARGPGSGPGNGPQPPSGQDNPITQETGTPGPFRLISGPLADQGGWLLVGAFLSGVVALVAMIRRKNWSQPSQLIIVLALAWMLPLAAYFSLSTGLFHRYYLSLLAPPVAVLISAWLAAAWKASPDRRPSWFMLITLGSTAVTVIILLNHAAWPLSPWLAGASVLAAAGSVLAWALRKPRVMVLLAAAALLVPPLVWSAATLAYAENGPLPKAGPNTAATEAASQDSSGGLEAVAAFLKANQGDCDWVVAVRAAIPAGSRLSLLSGGSVLAIGGFGGSDRIISEDGVRELARQGRLRYLLVEEGFVPMTLPGNEDTVAALKADARPVEVTGLDRTRLTLWELADWHQGGNHENP